MRVKENIEDFYSSEDSDSQQSQVNELDPDHELLLRSTMPLLHSRNNGVR